ncbi:MAG: hypothetical protein ACYDD7_18605 [Acidimicrobiales bacterium]
MSEVPSSAGDPARRIPLVLLDERPGPARERGVRDLYLREVRLQCRFALRALGAALAVAEPETGEDDGTWFAVQAALAAVAIVSRLLVGDDIRGDQAAKRLGLERGQRLCTVLATDPDSPVLDRRLRNHLEHIDQRLDEIAQDDRTSVIIDRFIVDGVRPVLFRDETHSEEAPLLRELAPRDGFVAFRGDRYDLFALRSELRRLDQAADRLLRDLAPPSEGATGVFIRLVPWARVDDEGNRIEGDPYQ